MGIQNWSENVLLVNLAKEPDMGEELATVLGIIAGQTDKDVVIDFSEADIVTSSSLSKLLKLRKALADNGRRLVLSSVRPQTYNVFRLTGLDSVFSFVQDLFLALAGRRSVNNPTSSAAGVGQLLEGTYRNLGMRHPESRVSQTIAALAYIGRKYGSGGPCAAWKHWRHQKQKTGYGWY